MKVTPHRSRRRFLQGFSLPEATISIGIAALGLTAVLGLLPQGLTTLKKAGDIATETRITQQILSTIAASEWVDATGKDLLVTEYGGRRFYFDDLAVELDTTPDNMDVAYVAEVQLPPRDVALPATGPAADPADPFLRRVIVKVGQSTGTEIDFKDAPSSTFRTYASVVSRSGR